ncbi:MAG: U32 family peptidase [Alphaproteobacteria bacterium]|nr:U32 family peptidase [Alphaproteobacteria bacterium]
MMKTELLAPAGDIEAAYAALYYGADAIYLGLKNFSARASATNFDENELNEITAYAHHLKRKVYVTINTVLQEHELPDLVKNLDICSKCKVDAVILQDLGVAHIIQTQYPEIQMHASTQMAVHNKEGALFLKNLGFSRVVLARELTLQEINDIASIEGLETEVFIHGALCYSYSGICEFSAIEYGKSANRGKCLYPCRACFEQQGDGKHIFSMKDMALEKDILKIKATSLKIEGRKKTALYVGAVTDYYRQILDGKNPDKSKAANIKQIFSRPWCKLHVLGKNKDVVDLDFVGHRGLKIGKIENISKGKLIFTPTHSFGRFDGLQIDVEGQEKPFGFSIQSIRQNGKNVFEAQKNIAVEIELPRGYPTLKKDMNVYLASSSKVKGTYNYAKPKPKEFQNKTNVDVKVEVFEDKIVANSKGFSFEVMGVFEKAKDLNKVYDAFLKSFQKTGETAFELGIFELKNPSGLFVPASIINDLRRGLYEKIKPDLKQGTLSYLPKPLESQKTGWVIKTDNLHLLDELELELFNEIIYLIDDKPDFERLSTLPFEKIRISLPTVCRKPELLMPSIQKLMDLGFKKLEVANYWGLQIIDSKIYDVSFAPFIYTLNTEAMMMACNINARRISFAMEDTAENIKELANKAFLPTSFIVYQDVPLFTSAVCIRKNDCAHCDGEPKWISLSKDGKHFEALSVPCQTMMFDKLPFCAASVAKDVHASYYQMDFCYKPYSAEQVKEIAKKLMTFADVEPSLKGNLFKTGI